MRVPKEWRPLADAVRAAGYSIIPGGKHYIIVNADGNRVGAFPCSPGDRKGTLAARTQLRRRGIL